MLSSYQDYTDLKLQLQEIKNHVQAQSHYLAVAELVIKPEACTYLPYGYGSYGRTGNKRPKFVFSHHITMDLQMH